MKQNQGKTFVSNITKRKLRKQSILRRQKTIGNAQFEDAVGCLFSGQTLKNIDKEDYNFVGRKFALRLKEQKKGKQDHVNRLMKTNYELKSHFINEEKNESQRKGIREDFKMTKKVSR